MDKLTSMQVFVRVAKTGSFAGAARDMDISRAMATKHIMQLENKLGTRLFNRTTRSLSLTDVGESYLVRCQQVLQDVEEMEAAVTYMQTEPRGVLKISAPPVIGATHIAPALSEFMKFYPELSVEMVLKSSLGDLVDEGIDVGIQLGEMDDSSLVARKLVSSSLVVCASKDYLTLYGEPETPDDLVNHSCLVNWAIQPRDQWRFVSNSGSGVKVIRVTGRMQANASDPIRVAAINSLGLVMLPKYIVGRDIQKGKLIEVLQEYALGPLPIQAVYPHRKYLTAKVRIFLDFLQHWMQYRVGMADTE